MKRPAETPENGRRVEPAGIFRRLAALAYDLLLLVALLVLILIIVAVD